MDVISISKADYIYEYVEGNNHNEFTFQFSLNTLPMHYQFVRISLTPIPVIGDEYSTPGAKAQAYPSLFKFFPYSQTLSGSFYVRGQKGCYSLNIYGEGTEVYQPVKVKLIIKSEYLNINPTMHRADKLFKYKTPINDITVKGDIDYLHKKNIHTIQNVFQELYKGNLKPTGLGDFIRGCYFLLQFCKKHNFNPSIIINHPIALYLKKFDSAYVNIRKNKEISQQILSNVSKFNSNNFLSPKIDDNGYITSENLDEKTIYNFVDYLCNINPNNNSIFTYNILFPYLEIEEQDKNYMKNVLEPNEEMKKYISQTLKKMALNKGKYMAIHIRCGDEYIYEETTIFSKKYLFTIFDEINDVVQQNLDIEYLIISDNNLIKHLVEKFLCVKHKNIKMLYNYITHVGETKVLDLQRVKNTLLDFYLLANSFSIYSISVYLHGSGFSFWCAKTYDIPHKCKYIDKLSNVL